MSNEQPECKVQLLHHNATVPSRGTEAAAGYDLYNPEDTFIPANSQLLIPIGIAMAIPDGWVGQINPRSSVASKRNLRIGARVIDSDYRGEIKVNLHNDTAEDVFIEEGERIAQMVILPHYASDLEVVDTLNETTRGDGGFGSTGI